MAETWLQLRPPLRAADHSAGAPSPPRRRPPPPVAPSAPPRPRVDLRAHCRGSSASRPIGGAHARGVARGFKLRHDQRLQLHVWRFPGECLGIDASTLLRARAQGQRRRRTLHPNLEREPAVGENLRHIEELRAALLEFATRYNETWLVARHGLSYSSPGASRPMPA
jgi:hypothetical protein